MKDQETMTNLIKIFLSILVFSFSHNALATTHEKNISQKIIFEEVNAYRIEHGLSPLVLNSVISEKAKSHSLAMANKSVSFGHDGFKNRMHDLFRDFVHAQGIAENVAYGDDDKTSHDLVKMWLKSPGHLRNIVGNYNLTGIGLAQSSNGRVFATQIFLKAQTNA